MGKMKLEDPRQAAVEGIGPDPVNAAALIYVGDQVGRVADVLETATEGQPVMQVISAVAQSLERFAEFMEQVAPEVRGEPGRAVKVVAGLSLDQAKVEPTAVSEVRDGLDAMANDMADLLRSPSAMGMVDAASVGAVAARLRNLLG